MKNVGNRKRSFLSLIAVGGALMMAACGKQSTTFSLLSSGASFQQATATVNNKIDILWVVDNSGSMGPLQQNLINNYSSFMNHFLTKGYDFQMAVTTSDAYLATAQYNDDPVMAKFRDGAGTTHSGVYVINPSTPNALDSFMINANQGANGSGDERILQSLLETLKSPLNSGFPRPGSFMAVIILADEDDFSNYSRPEGVGTDHSYTQAGLLAIDDVIAQLDAITASTATSRNYNVNAITVKDDQCLQQHKQNAPSATMGTRFIELANKTNGVLGSVCDASYAQALEFIQQRIVSLATRFALGSEPNVSTIVVTVDGVQIPNDPVTGWQYDSATNSIVFSAQATPGAGAAISVSYDPMGLQ